MIQIENLTTSYKLVIKRCYTNCDIKAIIYRVSNDVIISALCYLDERQTFINGWQIEEKWKYC